MLFARSKLTDNAELDIQQLRKTRFREILVGIEEDARNKSGVTWRELVLVPINRRRVILIICLQISVQLTGNTSMAYCKSTARRILAFS